MPDTQIPGLPGLPVTELQVLRLAPEDTLVVRAEGLLSTDAMARLAACVKLATGHPRVLVLDQGLALEVLRPADGAHAQTPGGGLNC